MRGSTLGVREIAALAACAVAAIAIAACAASTATRSTPQADEIVDVQVEHDGEATVLTLVGPDHPVFTAYGQADPEQVVVELASVSPGGVAEELRVDDGLVESVAITPSASGLGEPMTRVEVNLARKASYDVVPGDGGVEIRLSADTGAELADPWALGPLPGESESGEAPELAEADAWDMEEMEESEPKPESLAPAPAPTQPATALLGLEATRAGDGAVVALRANGSLDAQSFTLENPDRLVIDLPGVTSQVDRERIEVGSPRAARVRIGAHAEMVRVVIDAGEMEDAFDGRRMIPTGAGLVVALGAGPSVEEAVAAALGGAAPEGEAELDMAAAEAALPLAGGEPEAAEQDAWVEMAPAPAELAPAPEAALPAADEAAAGGPVTIYGVEYDAQASRDRVVVLGERPFDYLVYEPDPETVVLSIEGAVIDPQVAERVAPPPGGPVSLITAFAQPDVKTPEVRVVVKRAAGLKPEVSRKGSLLLMDFARDGGVAATPPVLSELEGVPLPAAGGETVVVAATSTPVPAGAASGAAALAAASHAGSPEAVPASLEPPAAIGLLEEGGLFDGKEYTGRRISLDFKDVEIADVLRLIAEVSDLNVIAGDEVSGRVTIRLVDVPWDQALDVILLTKSLGFMRVGNVLRIAPAEVIKQEEEMRLQERRAKEKLEDLVVKLQPVNYADVKDLEKMVKKLLSPRGSVNVDQRTNTLILKDIPSVIDEATALIKAIDTQTPQVMIEAKIVEANLDFSREFGSVWSFGAQPLVDGFDPGSGPRSDLGNDFYRVNTASGLGNNAQFANPITSFPTAAFNVAGFILDEKLNLGLQLQAAEVNGDGKVISSPRVVTLDNSKAEIEQGVSIPFQTFENGDAQLEFIDAVLKLEVTPHITADKSIIMDVKVSRNAPDDSVFTLTGSPAIAKNEVETETLVKDGQTLVLGGIYVIDKSARQSRVPYLHRIPLLGGAFRSDEISDSRKELLIFVTPHIVIVPQTAS